MSEDRDFPKLGQRYIVRLNQVWQEETYVADQADGEICAGERLWSRDDLDECPSFNYEKDDWISIREAVSNRGQLAALKEENERLREIEQLVWHLLDEAMDDGSGELKISIYNNTDLDELNKLLPEDHHHDSGERISIRAERDALKSRVAELEGTSEALRSSLENAAAMLSGAIRDGRLSEIDRIVFSDKRKMELSEILDFANEILGATLKEPANEG